MPIAAQKHAEIIEPSHYALQLNAVDQENGQGRLLFPDVIEKRVLKILRAVGRHCRCSVSTCGNSDRLSVSVSVLF
jgi:hypothetical protein